MSELGRQVKYGIGKGADVTPSNWVNQLKFELNPQVDYIENTSAFGVIERSNSSAINHQWAEGTLEAKLTSDTAGLILLGAMGTVSSADNADTNPVVKDYTFTIFQDINGQPFTFVRKDALSTKKYTAARIGKWELKMALKDYITFSADVMAKKGVTTTATPAYNPSSTLSTTETEFVAKHFTVKTAPLASGLAGATAVATVEDFTLTIDPNLTADYGGGSSDPYGFSSRGYDFEFSMTCRYNDTSYEDAYNNGTQLALQVSAINSDVTIGASAHPGLVFTAPAVNVTDWARSEDLDKPMTQKLKGTIHYSPADAYALKAVLTNTTASY